MALDTARVRRGWVQWLVAARRGDSPVQVSVRFRCDAVPMRLARVSNPFSGLRADSVLWRRLAGVGRQLVCVAAECAQLVGACCSDLLVRASLRAAHVSWCATDRAAYATVERGRLPTLGVMARLCLLSRKRCDTPALTGLLAPAGCSSLHGGVAATLGRC